MNNAETKQCKKCKESINKKAKVCPICGSKQRKPIWLIVIIVIVLFGIISGTGNNDSTDSLESKENNSSEEQSNNSSNKQDVIEYIKVSKDDLDDALESNAAVAKDTYDNKYIEVTGKLGTIDSDLQYISLVSATDEWDFSGIHCTIKNSAQKDIVKTLAKEQEITIRGKVTDVGEVLGYYLDIIEIIK